MSGTAAALRKARLRRDLPPPAMRRALREAAQLSQQDVADGLRHPVSREAVSSWEAGTRHPSSEHLADYVELLGELRELLDGDAA
jgi:DNA-binding transcriptional regulator YiaG